MEAVNKISTQYTRDEKFILGVGLTCTGITIVLFILLFFNQFVSQLEKQNIKPLFGTASAVILFGMFGLYMYSAAFYKDGFYQLIAIGWLTNGLYIILETFFVQDRPTLDHALKIYIIGTVTTLPIYAASCLSVEDTLSYHEIIIPTSKWIMFLIICFAVTSLLIKEHIPDPWLFAVYAVPGIAFACRALFKVGNILKSKLNPDIHGRWVWVFPVTFYVYASLQPFYAFKLFDAAKSFISVVLVIALASKIANSISALSIVQLDFADAQKQLQQRSVLEDLGALTASIEHDIKNPLQVVDSELRQMQRRFQANQEIMGFIHRLEEQRRRIYATTRIIPIIRGEKAYYEKFMEKTSVRDLVNRSVKAVKGELNTKDIIFKVEGKILYTKSFPPMIEQAVVNILRNSVEAIREANRENGLIQIIIANDSEFKDIRIDFRDNGCGIPEEILPDITKLFMTTRGKSKPNSGIGLFITTRILRVHNGRLIIKNNSDQGVTASIFLPEWKQENSGGTKAITSRKTLSKKGEV